MKFAEEECGGAATDLNDAVEDQEPQPCWATSHTRSSLADGVVKPLRNSPFQPA